MKPDVPEGWVVEPLEAVAEVLLSNVDKKSSAEEVPVKLCNYMDVYSNAEIRAGLTFMEATATAAQVKKFGLRLGDVLITKDSEDPSDIAVPSVVADEFDGSIVCGYHLALLRPRKIDGPFLSWALRSRPVNDQFARRANGTTRFGLTKNVIRSTQIPLPPLPEQRKIAVILSSVDGAIAATQKVIEQTRRVKQGLLQTLMTRGIGHTRFKKTEIGEIPEAWEVVPFASVVRERVLGTAERGEGGEDGYQLVKMGNLTWGGLDLSTIESVERTDTLRDLELQRGDFLFNTRNTPELVGKTAVWGDSAGEAIPDNNIMRVRFHDRVLSEFVCGQVAHGRGRARLRRLAAGSTSVAAIYWKDLARYPVAVPPVEEQEEIITALRRIDGQITRSEAVVRSSERTKQGLMQELLTGRLRVQPD